MIELAWPWVLAILPLPWLLSRLLPPARAAAGGALRLPFYRELPGGAESGSAVRSLSIASAMMARVSGQMSGQLVKPKKTSVSRPASASSVNASPR